MSGRTLSRGWWLWVAGGVAWGLLCVGVRHASLTLGTEMRELIAERNLELARVQALERSVAGSRGFESMERRAAAAGFIRPPAGRVVIVPADAEPGLLARWFGPPAAHAEAAAEPLPIRPREEVVTARRVLRAPAEEARRAAAAREKAKPKPKAKRKGRSR